MKWHVFGILFACAFVFSFAGQAHAASVASFSVNSSSVNNAYPVSFSWSVNDGSGGNFAVPSCPTGVTVVASTGAALCGSSIAEAGGSGSDYVTVYNVSGGAKNLSFSFTPKDTAGTLASEAAVSAQVTVGAVTQPITDFSIAATSIASGGTQTLTWTGVYIPGVNLQFDCNDSLTVSAGGTTLLCGVPAFSADLGASGSQVITVTNKTRSDAQLTARLLPAMAAGAYDATHAVQTVFNVAPAGAASSTSATPSVTSFLASNTAVFSGGALDLSWATQNASGVNIMFTCDSSVKLTTMVGDATTTLICNSNAFAAALPASGTLHATVSNTNYYTQIFGATILPQDANGIYLSQYAKVLSLTVREPGASTAPAATAANSSAPLAGAAAALSAVAHAPITKPLWKGVTDAQVKILQQFLAYDTSIYPLGLVSGYFGGLTEAAVQKFQVKYNLAKPGDSAYGFVGPMTRAKINSLTTP